MVLFLGFWPGTHGVTVQDWLPMLGLAAIGAAIVLFAHACDAVFDIADAARAPRA
jgi:hypothetical protein